MLAASSTLVQDPLQKITSTDTSSAATIAPVQSALLTPSPPAAMRVAEFSLNCNRKYTCRSLITGAIETALGPVIEQANIISVDFATATTIGLQASIYSLVKASQSKNINNPGSSIGGWLIVVIVIILLILTVGVLVCIFSFIKKRINKNTRHSRPRKKYHSN